MAYGSQPAAKSDYNPDDYAYLCPDASKRPVTGTPCSWAARPWQGYLTSDQDQQTVAALRETITKLNDLGEQSHADWISSVLALNNKTLARDNNGPYAPQQYLEKGVSLISDSLIYESMLYQVQLTKIVESFY